MKPKQDQIKIVREYLEKLLHINYPKMVVTKVNGIRKLLECVTSIIEAYRKDTIDDSTMSYIIHDLNRKASIHYFGANFGKKKKV